LRIKDLHKVGASGRFQILVDPSSMGFTWLKHMTNLLMDEEQKNPTNVG
jgi:hypothetical protein